MGFNFIVEKKARRAAFRKRSSGLLKKAEVLSTLCDVDVCLFIVGDGAIDGVHWPTSPSELQRIVGLFHSSHNAMIKKKKKKKRNKNQHPSASASASASHSPREMQGMPLLREDLKSAIADVRERIDHLLLQRETEQLPSSSSALQIQEALDDGNSSSPQSLNLDHDFYGGSSSSGEGLDDGNSSNHGSQALQSLNLEAQQARSHQLLPMPPMVQHLGPICSSSCTTYTDMLLGNGIDDDDFDLFSQLPSLAGVEAEVDDCTDEIACSSSSLDYTESNSLCWSNSLNNAADQDPVAVTEPSNEFEIMQMASFFPRFLSAQDDAIATIPSTDIEMMDGCYF